MVIAAWRVLTVASLTIAMLIMTALPIEAASVAPLTPVSGLSPYPNCTPAQVVLPWDTSGQPDIHYVNAEVEPSVAVNPKTVGTAHQPN